MGRPFGVLRRKGRGEGQGCVLRVLGVSKHGRRKKQKDMVLWIR